MHQLTLAHLKQIIDGTVPEFSPAVFILVPIRNEDGTIRNETRRAIACIPGDVTKEFAVYIKAAEEDIKPRAEAEQEQPKRAKRRRGWLF